jgi:MFS family permease
MGWTPAAEALAADLGGRLDRLRWSSAHLSFVILLGAGWLFDSFEVNLVGSFVGPMQRHFHASDTQASLIFWSWLVGILAGALAGGSLADRFGRRRLFMGTLLWYACFTVLTGLSPTLTVLLVLRFLTGLGVGAEYAIINAAICELMPARHRGKVNAGVMNFWPVGAIVSASLALLLLDTLRLGDDVSWRYGFALGGIVALLVVLLRRRIPESPRWLVSQGRGSEAEAIVARMESASGGGAARTGVPAATAAPGGLRASLVELVTRHPGRLALGCALDLSEAFGYYGVFALVAIVGFRSIGVGEGEVPWFFILGNVGALAGGLLMTALFDSLGRARVVPGFYLFAAAGAVLLGLALRSHSAGLVLLAFMVSNAGATGAWTSAYPAFTELFPTHLRGTGVGASVAVGRLGAGFGVTLVVAAAGSSSVLVACLVVAGLWLLGAAAMAAWVLGGGPEAAGRSLEELAPARVPAGGPLARYER